MKNILKNLKSNSLQWEILRLIFIACFLTGFFSILLFTYGINPLMDFFPSEASGNLFIIIFLCLFLPFLFTVLVGLPITHIIKAQLYKLREAHQSLCKGHNDTRLSMPAYREFGEIVYQFNCMADRTQKQVESLQRLVTENASLIKNAEVIASLGERRKIARELHDAISQQLFAISITMTACKTIVEHNPTEAKKHFEQIEAMVHLAQQELRALIMHLRPVSLNGASFTSGLAQLLEELKEKNNQIQIYWEISETPPLSSGIEDHLFRVIQEAISNVLRHSKASKLEVKLMIKNKLLMLFVEDNGVGFKSTDQKKSSYGIITMEERISEIGGRIDVYSYPSQGTRIEIRVPIEKLEQKM